MTFILQTQICFYFILQLNQHRNKKNPEISRLGGEARTGRCFRIFKLKCPGLNLLPSGFLWRRITGAWTLGGSVIQGFFACPPPPPDHGSVSNVVRLLEAVNSPVLILTMTHERQIVGSLPGELSLFSVLQLWVLFFPLGNFLRFLGHISGGGAFLFSLR